MKNIREQITEAGGVEPYLAGMKAQANIRKMRNPTRQPQQGDTKVGRATEEIMRLVWVYRQLKAMAVPFENIVQPVDARIAEIVSDLKGKSDLVALIDTLTDPKIREDVVAREAAARELTFINVLKVHVRNTLTLELRALAASEPASPPEIDANWDIVVPAEQTNLMSDDMPPELAELMAKMTDRGARVFGFGLGNGKGN